MPFGRRIFDGFPHTGHDVIRDPERGFAGSLSRPEQAFKFSDGGLRIGG